MKSAKSYNSYKPSGIGWVPSIPENWEIVDTKRCFNFPKEIVGEDFVNYKVLSLSVNGVIFRNVASGAGKQHSDMGTYQIIRPDSIVLCLFDMDVTPRIVGHSDKTGIITSAYVNIIPKLNISSKYYYYYFILQDFNKYLFSQGTGIRTTLTRSQFGALKIALPSFEEQTTIARFLDYKLAKINRFIQKKKQLIKLLSEQKAAIINQAVTKGLDPNAKMKDSGIEWLGEIPQHWQVRKLKYSVRLNSHTSFENQESENTKIALENIESKTGRILELSQNAFEGIGTIFKKGDVLFGKLRPYLAKVATPIFEGNCVNEILVFTPDNRIWNHEFLKYRILASDFISLVDNSTYGAKMPRASWSFIGSLKLSSPPLIEQTKIIEHIEEQHSDTNLLIAKIEKEIALSEEYKTALIAEAVTGKIDVRRYEVPEIVEEATYEEIEEEISMAAEDAEEYQTIEE
jgi:type I restriction enzyme, S subunit